MFSNSRYGFDITLWPNAIQLPGHLARSVCCIPTANRRRAWLCFSLFRAGEEVAPYGARAREEGAIHTLGLEFHLISRDLAATQIRYLTLYFPYPFCNNVRHDWLELLSPALGLDDACARDEVKRVWIQVIKKNATLAAKYWKAVCQMGSTSEI